MLPLVMALVQAGLPILADAVVSKGREFVEQKTGIKLPDIPLGQGLSSADALALKTAEIGHEEFLLRCAIEARGTEQVATTDRWKSDNLTDSWLTRNIRPLLMLALFGALALFALMSIPGWGQPIAGEWIELFKSLATTAFAAYFGGRTIEKAITTWKGSRVSAK